MVFKIWDVVNYQYRADEDGDKGNAGVCEFFGLVFLKGPDGHPSR
jgi:hypothetical protein